jgi:hypothetical protein
MSGRWDDKKTDDQLIGVTRGRLKLMMYLSISVGFGMGIIFSLVTGWLTDEIKKVNIGQKFMNHALECPECMEMSKKLNEQIARHVAELEALT